MRYEDFQLIYLKYDDEQCYNSIVAYQEDKTPKKKEEAVFNITPIITILLNKCSFKIEREDAIQELCLLTDNLIDIYDVNYSTPYSYFYTTFKRKLIRLSEKIISTEPIPDTFADDSESAWKTIWFNELRERAIQISIERLGEKYHEFVVQLVNDFFSDSVRSITAYVDKYKGIHSERKVIFIIGTIKIILRRLADEQNIAG